MGTAIQNAASFESNVTTPRISLGDQPAVKSPEVPPNALNSEGIDAMDENEPRSNSSEDKDLEKGDQDVETPEKGPEKDPNLVDWDGPNDPEHPQNMPVWRKWVVTMTLSFMTMWITFASSVFSTATVVTSKEFGVSTEVMTLATSLVVFGFALGPLVWSPLSELYGRKIPLFSGYAVFAIFQIPVAVAQNIETIMLCRFLLGVFGCSPLAVVGGAMADFWDPVDRAIAIAMFSAATFVGPVLGALLSQIFYRGSSNMFQVLLLVDLSPIRISDGDGLPGSP